LGQLGHPVSHRLDAEGVQQVDSHEFLAKQGQSQGFDLLERLMNPLYGGNR
jgi:hypothetical protein